MRSKYMRHTREGDKVILEVMNSRGNNSQKTAAGKARKELFKLTGYKYSVSAITNRYYWLRNQKKPQKTVEKQESAVNILRDLLTSRDNYTIEVKGKEIHVVFK